MQSRREFFARLAVLCGAAAAVPAAAKALSTKPTSTLYIRGAGGEWIKVATLTDPVFTIKKFGHAEETTTWAAWIANKNRSCPPVKGYSISCTFTHDLKPGQLLHW